MLKIFPADSRDKDLVLQIMWIDDIVGNPVSQHEIPRGLASARGIEKHWGAHTRMSRPRPNCLV